MRRASQSAAILLWAVLLTACAGSSAPMVTLGTPGDAVASLTIEEYPIVAADIAAPNRFEFLHCVPDDILARRERWRGFDAMRRVSAMNEKLAPFGCRLVAEENAKWHRVFYELYRGDELVLSDLSYVWPVTVSESGTDFAFVAANAPDKIPPYLLVRSEDVQALDPDHFTYLPPVYLGNDLVTVEMRGNQLVVKRGDEVVYTHRIREIRADLPVKRLLAWEGHWILEVAGEAIVDGESLNEQLGVDEIFHFIIFHGKPLFFFEEDGQVGISHGGEKLPLAYDEVVHYQCCEAAMFNVASNEHMIWFYALKGGMWHYVEIGIYK